MPVGSVPPGPGVTLVIVMLLTFGVPVVVTVCVSFTPTVNVLALALVICGGSFTLKFTIFWPVQPPGPVAVMVALKGPATVGVPVTSPVLLLMPTPVGRPVADHVIGVLLPVCVNDAVAIAWPLIRSGIVPLTVMVGQLTVIVIVA